MKLEIRMLIIALAILIVTGIISGWVTLYIQRKASAAQFERTARVLAGAVHGSLEQDMMLGDRGHVQEALVRIGQEKVVSEISLATPDGVVVASSAISSIGQLSADPHIRSAVQAGEEATWREASAEGGGLRVVTPVLRKPECQGCHAADGPVLGAIVVSLDTDSLDTQARQQTLFQGIVAGSTFVVVAGALSFALRRTIIWPLSRVSESARRIASGDYGARVQEAGKDEIGTLARSFNAMAESVQQRSRDLQASQQELAEWNTDLEAKIQRRTRELSALNAIITTINQSLDLNRIVIDALSEIMKVADAEAGVVHLLDDRGERLVAMAHQGLSAVCLAGIMKLPLGRGIPGRVMESGEPVVVTDHLEEPEGISLEGEQGQLRGLIALPVKSKDRVVGVLTLGRHDPGAFDPEEVPLLSAMGEAVGIAVEKARGAQRLSEANTIREQLLQKLISAQEAERSRIARELHDEASQSLAALALDLEVVGDTLPAKYQSTRRSLGLLKQRAIEVIGGMRDLALELRPSALDDLGLSQAVSWYAKDYLGKRGLDVRVDVAGSGRRMPSHVETMLFRIIQEALTNVVKHAGATQVRVGLELGDSVVIARVEDNGRGFDVDAALSKDGVRRSLGLHGMVERAVLLGGKLSVASQPGQGTRLEVRVPLDSGCD